MIALISHPWVAAGAVTLACFCLLAVLLLLDRHAVASLKRRNARHEEDLESFFGRVKRVETKEEIEHLVEQLEGYLDLPENQKAGITHKNRLTLAFLNGVANGRLMQIKRFEKAEQQGYVAT